MAKDPVCGMKVDEQYALATSSYAGVTYSFCSPYCKQQFDQQPEQYARRAPERFSHREDELAEAEEAPRTHHQTKRHYSRRW